MVNSPMLAAKKPVKPLKPITDYALAIVAKREHSTTELKRKLTIKGYPKAEVADLITQFVSKNYLNDERYAQTRARTRAENSKWGQGRIKQELAQNGIDKTMTASTLEDLSERHDWFAAATNLLQRRFPKPIPTYNDVDPSLNKQEALKDIQKEKARRLNFLLRRGFSMPQALHALGLQADEAMAADE